MTADDALARALAAATSLTHPCCTHHRKETAVKTEDHPSPDLVHDRLEDRPHTGVPDGAALIAAERRRQIEVEGWTPEHDTEHDDHDLVFAAACYVTPDYARFLTNSGIPADWPWEPSAWKPTPDDRVRELVKAGALIAAEIDRLQAREARRG